MFRVYGDTRIQNAFSERSAVCHQTLAIHTDNDDIRIYQYWMHVSHPISACLRRLAGQQELLQAFSELFPILPLQP
jgi:hypothetical protein